MSKQRAKEKRPLECGDRVSYKHDSGTDRGTVDCIDFLHDWIGVLLDSGLKVRVYERSSLKRLTPKPKVAAEREELREALRKLIAWSEGISFRFTGEDRAKINWRYLNEARDVYEKSCLGDAGGNGK